MTLAAGDKAPDFALPADDGGTLGLGDLAGRKAVLYFYPKDDTPGCTTEARDFTELAQAFAEADTAIVGVSKDTVEKHRRFVDKHVLGIRLLSDAEGGLCEAFGVWQEKKLYGRIFMGIVRATFLIGRDGRIARAWPKVRVKGHAAEVLEAARLLD